MADDHDREFVEYVIKNIVTKPEAVQVTRTVDELGVLLTVKVAAEDMGLLIGRSGSTAKAVRTLARIVGMRSNSRVNVRIAGRAANASYHAASRGRPGRHARPGRRKSR